MGSEDLAVLSVDKTVQVLKHQELTVRGRRRRRRKEVEEFSVNLEIYSAATCLLLFLSHFLSHLVSLSIWVMPAFKTLFTACIDPAFKNWQQLAPSPVLVDGRTGGRSKALRLGRLL